MIRDYSEQNWRKPSRIKEASKKTLTFLAGLAVAGAILAGSAQYYESRVERSFKENSCYWERATPKKGDSAARIAQRAIKESFTLGRDAGANEITDLVLEKNGWKQPILGKPYTFLRCPCKDQENYFGTTQ